MIDQQINIQPQKPLEIPSDIKAFLESLLNDAGMQTLDQPMREEMVKELYVRLDQHMTATIIDKLPAEYLEAFIKMGEEKKSMVEIQQFLTDKMPNAQEVFARAFADFRETYLGGVTTSRNVQNVMDKNKIVDAQTKPIN